MPKTGRPQKVTDEQIINLLPATAGQLSKHTGLNRSTMGQRLWRLVADGSVVAWQLDRTATVFVSDGDTPFVFDCLGAKRVTKGRGG